MRVLPGSRRVIILRYGPRIASAWEAPPHVMDRIGETSPHSAKTQEASMLCSDDDTVMKKRLPRQPLNDSYLLLVVERQPANQSF